MANSNKFTKVEIISSDGVATDITEYVTSTTFDAVYNTNPCCPKCYTYYPEYKFLSGIRLWLFKVFHKCKPFYISGIENVEFKIQGKFKTRRLDFWKWN